MQMLPNGRDGAAQRKYEAKPLPPAFELCLALSAATATFVRNVLDIILFGAKDAAALRDVNVAALPLPLRPRHSKTHLWLLLCG